MKYKKSLFAGLLAFFLGTSCCWLTSLAVWIGGASLLTASATIFGRLQTPLMVFAGLLFGSGLIQLWAHRNKNSRSKR